jgi:hypothetical protein
MDSRLLDNRLVRSVQEIGAGEDIVCDKDCDFKRASVTFPFSVLDIREEILENDISFNQLSVGLEEEAAPVCDELNAEFVAGADAFTPPTLEIELLNCRNTIGTDTLEFGISRNFIVINRFKITDVQRIINNSPVNPDKAGYDYKISLSLDDIKDLFGPNATPSTVDALTTDLIVALRNKDGISALVYGIENRCTVQHGGGKE